MKEDTDSDEGIKPVTRAGITVRIRSTEKNGFERFVVDYRNQGQRKLVWRSSLAEARKAANDAIDKISEGQGEVLNLKAADAHAFTRSRAILNGSDGETKIDLQIDEAVRIAADCLRLLGGRAIPQEVCRDWLKRHAVELPKITVADAVEEFYGKCAADGKTKRRIREIKSVLNRLADAFHVEIHTLESKQVSDHLIALPFSERTKHNHRSNIGFFNRWAVLRGYLAKGTDWLEGVQHYSAQLSGEIEIYTPDEMRRLIDAADDGVLPLLVLGGFAGLRHEEIKRLDWQDIDLDEGFIEVKASKAKTKVRRIVPVKPNLIAFLLPLAKKHGKVISMANSSNALLELAEATGDQSKGIAPLKWKHNALRHSFISYRIAESADVSRVSDEAGNSPQVIRTNYLKRVRPAVAAEWFAIQPSV